MVLTLASVVTSSARLWVCSWYLHWRPWWQAVPGCGSVHDTYIGIHGDEQCHVVGVFIVLTLESMVTSSARLWVCSWYLHWRPWWRAVPGCGCVHSTYIGIRGDEQCQVVGVFIVLTLASVVMSSARLWVCSWYLHWRPWWLAVPGCGYVHGTYISVHGDEQCQVVGVFMILTLVSVVTSSARLWVCS